MPSKTLLLDLPNELFPFIFQYLSSIDILNAFIDFQSHRIQCLIQPFISRLDVSQESSEWIQTYLPDIIIKHEIIALRIEMKNLAFISEHLSSTGILSMEVIKWYPDFQVSEEVMGQLRRHLKKLSMIIPELDESDELAHLLFRSDSQLKHLIIKDCVFCLWRVEISTCTQLTNLSVQLEGMHEVFVLVEHLPNLQELQVKIRSQECIRQTAPITNGIKPRDTLRSVTFTGCIKYFDHLESFFDTFGSTVECLTLKIHLMYHKVDGKQLEQQILDKIPHLTTLDLMIFSAPSGVDPTEIETFQSFTWQKFNPVVYWNDVHAQQHTIFTLPYKFDTFECFSNDFLSTCVSNRSVSFYFPRVRTLSLINPTPFNLETLMFIRKVFPNITTVELTDWSVHSSGEGESDNDEEETDTSVLLMSEDLLSDANLKIPSVSKFCITVWNRQLDHKTFRCFLKLFPNLIDLRFDIQHPLLRDVLKHEHEDELIETVLVRVKQLEIIHWHGKDTLTDAEIHYLFPNVKILVKPESNEMG